MGRGHVVVVGGGGGGRLGKGMLRCIPRAGLPAQSVTVQTSQPNADSRGWLP